MQRPDLEYRALIFFSLDFFVDGSYEHFVVAFLTGFAFFEDVVSSLKLPDVLEAAFLTFDSSHYWWDFNPQF